MRTQPEVSSKCQKTAFCKASCCDYSDPHVSVMAFTYSFAIFRMDSKLGLLQQLLQDKFQAEALPFCFSGGHLLRIVSGACSGIFSQEARYP